MVEPLATIAREGEETFHSERLADPDTDGLDRLGEPADDAARTGTDPHQPETQSPARLERMGGEDGAELGAGAYDAPARPAKKGECGWMTYESSQRRIR